MLRESRIEGVPEHISEVASAIAEEGLRYVSDSSPGYRRKRKGTSFTYYDKDGKRITDKAVIRRIKSIGIPRPTSSSGSIPRPTDTFRQRASMREGASSTATMRNGGNSKPRTSTSTSWSSRQRFLPCGIAWRPT
jgi:hypothetical protein